MVSTTSWIICGIIILIAVIVIWKLWKSPVNSSKKDDTIKAPHQIIDEERYQEPYQEQHDQEQHDQEQQQEPPQMLFAVNDDGNFDLTDMSGKILNIGFGPNPKTYINLLDQSEKDTVKDEVTNKMESTVGTTKLYNIGGRPYIVNFTRL